MSKLDWALHHAELGFWVFRIRENQKKPKYKGWQQEATRDPDRIKKLWGGRDENANVGAFTSHYKNKALVVVDVDIKNGRDGNVSLLQLDFEGRDVPDTYENITATGGRHIVYSCKQPVKQGANVIGEGLDIRSRGGYIVMAGSTIFDKAYTSVDNEIVEAPEWLFNQLLAATNLPAKRQVNTSNIDPDRARDRAEKYLDRAPMPEEGTRNDTAFKVACQFKDCGLEENICEEFMNIWNGKLDAPINSAELAIVTGSAYKTGQNQIGSNAAEAMFDKVEAELKEEKKEEAPVVEDTAAELGKNHPFNLLNKEYAMTLSGGSHHIIWETKDEKGKYRLEHLNEASFHRYNCHRTADIDVGQGPKREPLTKLWLNDRRARRYEGIVFAPGREVNNKFYNLWRGYSVERINPTEADEESIKGFEAFMEHTLLNICKGNKKHFEYLMDFAAHMLQKPEEKPGVLVVFKGKKGVGKNVWVETLFSLIKAYTLVVDNRRYLNSNFNSHLEGRLAAAFDEAFWAGEKENEGPLKGLITGSEIWIERKGIEPYPIPNILRIFFLSNEHWVVPASADERRYFVLDVGDARIKDVKFFKPMVRRMKAGGNRLFLTYLLERDISKFEPHTAPETQALVDQKHASLEPFPQWWYNCLAEGELLGAPMTGANFARINCAMFKNAFGQYTRQHHVRSRLPDDRHISNTLAEIAPSLIKTKVQDDGGHDYCYLSDGIEQLRTDWENYIGASIDWPVIKIEGEIECLR